MSPWQPVGQLYPDLAGQRIDIDGKHGTLSDVTFTGMEVLYYHVEEQQLCMNGPVWTIGGLDRFILHYTGGSIELHPGDTWRPHEG